MSLLANKVTPAFIFISLLYFSSNVLSIDFYVWYDSKGGKHVSTYPQECIDKINNTLTDECRVYGKFQVKGNKFAVREEKEKVREEADEKSRKDDLVSGINSGNCSSIEDGKDKSECLSKVRKNKSEERKYQYEKEKRQEAREKERERNIAKAKADRKREERNKEFEKRMEKIKNRY